MALPIVFDNQTFDVNYLSADGSGVQNNVFENNSNNPNSYVLNGTVNKVGDPVTFTSNGAGASFTVYATNLDNASQIVFTENQDGSGTAYIASNTPLTEGNTETFTENNLGDYSATCFVTGTTIRTIRGEVAVEDLVVGDIAVTASGAQRPIRWIGHRDLKGAGKLLPHDLQPIRIRAGAFGPGIPARDLSLSPGHPVLVGANAVGEGGVLVPVMCLVNGTTIAREAVEAVTYWHVELNAHDILLAEGLPAESYYDMGSRPWFSGQDGALIDPEFVPAGAHGRCRPVAVGGSPVEAERLRLNAVFSADLARHGAWNDADAWLAA